MGKATLTRDEFEVIINNYKNSGKDTRELEAALAEAYPEKKAPRGNPPQRKKWVAAGEAAPPSAFDIEPIMEGSTIVGFTIYDPDATTIRSRSSIAEAIHEQYPRIRKEEIESASIGYEDYVATVSLARFL